MVDDTHPVLWCFIKGDSKAFEVTPPGKASIDRVKKFVWDRGENGVLSKTDAKDLVLWKVCTERLVDRS